MEDSFGTNLYRIGELGVGVDGDLTGKREGASIRVDTSHIIFLIPMRLHAPLHHRLHHHLISYLNHTTHIELLDGIRCQWHNFGSIMTTSGTSFTAAIHFNNYYHITDLHIPMGRARLSTATKALSGG